MSQAYIVGAAMIPMGKHRESSYSGLAVPAVLNALKSAGVAPKAIEAVTCGHAFGGMLTGQRIVKEIGIGTVPVVNVDNACSGGATALHRSEEHTSELQSLMRISYAVFCLKKKNSQNSYYKCSHIILYSNNIEIQQS